MMGKSLGSLLNQNMSFQNRKRMFENKKRVLKTIFSKDRTVLRLKGKIGVENVAYTLNFTYIYRTKY